MTSRVLVNATAKVAKPERLSKFVDTIRVQFQGGPGGNGCISMLSLFANEFAGPDGGNGGCGGHVVLRANKQIKSFNHVKSRYRGLSGLPGKGKNIFGLNAEHMFIDVPVGTLVTPAGPKDLAYHEIDPDKSDIIADLDREGSMFIAARGGAGGRGNHSFLTNANRHPRVAEAGAMGETNTYDLRMRMYAHIALVGLPNVGKSTLLKTLTNANVKIGNYFFTTRHPQVGVLEYDDFTQIAISDLPGLIEDSNKNRGLGVRFLRSVERCVCLLYVVDMSTDPATQLEKLFMELELHKRGLSERPHMIFGNKMDDPISVTNVEPLKEYLASRRPNTTLVLGSSLYGGHLEKLRSEFKSMYEIYKAKHDDELEDALIW